MMAPEEKTSISISESDQQWLWRSWRRAWQGLDAKGEGESVFNALLKRYAEPHRKYHNLQHLMACLVLFDEVSEQAKHPEAVEMALWFHDAVYALDRSDNEEKSAALAKSSLVNAAVKTTSVLLVEALVLATRHVAEPANQDEALLVDIDLAILGTSPKRFAEYEQQVRAEYAAVPEAIFQQGRHAILQSFLRRPFIYNTAYFRTSREQQARVNLQKTIHAYKI